MWILHWKYTREYESTISKIEIWKLWTKNMFCCWVGNKSVFSPLKTCEKFKCHSDFETFLTSKVNVPYQIKSIILHTCLLYHTGDSAKTETPSPRGDFASLFYYRDAKPTAACVVFITIHHNESDESIVQYALMWGTADKQEGNESFRGNAVLQRIPPWLFSQRWPQMPVLG